MNPQEILDFCLSNLDGTVFVESWGEKGVFYNPEGKLKRGVYTLTIKEKNGENDKASDLDRSGIFRINIGSKKQTFLDLFKCIPHRPQAGGVVDMPYDFTCLNRMIPHPVYGWMGWVCMLSPDQDGFERLKPYIQESYLFAIEK